MVRIEVPYAGPTATVRCRRKHDMKLESKHPTNHATRKYAADASPTITFLPLKKSPGDFLGRSDNTIQHFYLYRI